MPPRKLAVPAVTTPRDFVSSLAKGLQVLSAFDHGELLGNQDLVAITGMPKNTVSRLTLTLAALGYLRVDEQTRKYRAGARVLGLGAALQRNIGLQRIARPHMEALGEELDLTVLLATREQLAMVVLEIARPARNAVTVNTQIGAMLRMETTSLGMAYLVAAPTKERVRLLDELRRKHPEDWNDYRRDVERVHQEYRDLGYVVSRRMWDGALSAVAAPISVGASGVFAMSCAGPSQQLTRTRIRNAIGPKMVQAVQQIARALSEGRPAEPPQSSRNAGRSR